MSKITIRSYGGVGEVGRSCFLIEDRDNRILVDCGIKLVPRRPAEFPKILNDTIRPYTIDAIVLTHGHLDHSGFIPRLFQEGFKGKFLLTPPTKEILKILYQDMIKLQKIQEHFVFNAKAAKIALKKSLTLNLKKWKKITDGIRIKFLDAGHVLGSGSVLIDWKGTLILYSGDIKVRKTPLHRGATVPNDEIELLITEATNALRELPDRDLIAKELINDIKKNLENGGKVLIPTLAYGRAQEILYELVRSNINESFPIILDGMLLSINKVYRKYLKKPWLSNEIIEFCKEKNLQWIDSGENIVKGFKGKETKREKIIKQKEPLVVLSTSGMLEGGPIHTYLLHTANNENNFMALVNYQVPGTLGREIEEGARRIELSFRDGRRVEVELKLKVKKYEFSGHASPDNLIRYAENVNPRKILIAHSEPPSAKHYAKRVKKILPNVEIINRFDEETFSLAYDNIFMEYEI